MAETKDKDTPSTAPAPDQTQQLEEARKRVAELTAQIEELIDENGKLEDCLQQAAQSTIDDPVDAIEQLVFIAGMTSPIVTLRGVEGPSPDRRDAKSFSPDGYVQVEEINLRNAVGYDENWRLNARAALDRALNQDFGSRSKPGGSLTFDALPAFDPMNRIVVVLAVLPPAEEQPAN